MYSLGHVVLEKKLELQLGMKLTLVKHSSIQT